jgi:Big-like domain-containing protein
VSDIDCSRREFLRKFAYLSGGALMLSATTMACYGPGGVYPDDGLAAPVVAGIFFLDPQSHTTPLQNNQDVPVHTKFTIEFSKDMNSSVPVAVDCTDSNNNPVAFDKAWDSIRILGLTPSADLAHAVTYQINITDAEDTMGFKIQITNNASATFKTASA